MGNSCSFPKTKITIQNQYNTCEKCKKNGCYTNISPLYLHDDFSSISEISYIIFMCDQGHIFEYYDEKKYLRWILLDYNRHKRDDNKEYYQTKVKPTAPPFSLI